MMSVDMSEVVAFSKLMEMEAVQAAKRVEVALVDMQKLIVSRAKADAPVGATGRLKADIRPIGRRGMSRRVRAGKKRSFYSRYQELGTRKMRAHPFLLKQANASTQAEFERRVSRVLGEGRLYK